MEVKVNSEGLIEVKAQFMGKSQLKQVEEVVNDEKSRLPLGTVFTGYDTILGWTHDADMHRDWFLFTAGTRILRVCDQELWWWMHYEMRVDIKADGDYRKRIEAKLNELKATKPQVFIR